MKEEFLSTEEILKILKEKPKNSIEYCNEVEVDGENFISDYRVKNGLLPISKGKLADLERWYLKGHGLGDLLGCVNLDMKEENYRLIEYKGKDGRMFALGI